jgi:hypothetical protein
MEGSNASKSLGANTDLGGLFHALGLWDVDDLRQRSWDQAVDLSSRRPSLFEVGNVAEIARH